MTQLLTPASKLRADAQQARRTLIGLLVKMTEGKIVSDAEITKARTAADVSALEVARLLETLAERKAAVEEYAQRDYAKELDDLMTIRKTLPADVEKAEKRLAEAREELRLLHERLTGAVHRSSRVKQERDAAAENRRKVLVASGGQTDWRDIR